MQDEENIQEQGKDNDKSEDEKGHNDKSEEEEVEGKEDKNRKQEKAEENEEDEEEKNALLAFCLLLLSLGLLARLWLAAARVWLPLKAPERAAEDACSVSVSRYTRRSSHPPREAS